MAKKDNKNSFLNMHVMQFTKDSLTHYDFKERFSATPYKINDNRIDVDTTSIGVFRFVDKNRFRLAPDRLADSIDFVRLLPTKTVLPKTAIEKMNFEIEYKGRTLTTNFGKTEQIKGPDTRLENINNTYFLSIYRNDRRLGSIPIKKVTDKQLVLYGFPEKPFEVSGEAISEK
ncbi:hypothetical protein DDV96_02570 [Marixanthomonas spongiae]|uniref:Uncharacterized protein n=2 Tax=Marixanthomonas spongiae TaxID=2174845 RepID=A0A2U0I8K0_9FLAO|nr:hypothetical protein DDV96_02570 [Marixanthomonas spongiae]